MATRGRVARIGLIDHEAHDWTADVLAANRVPDALCHLSICRRMHSRSTRRCGDCRVLGYGASSRGWPRLARSGSLGPTCESFRRRRTDRDIADRQAPCGIVVASRLERRSELRVSSRTYERGCQTEHKSIDRGQERQRAQDCTYAIAHIIILEFAPHAVDASRLGSAVGVQREMRT